MIKLNQAEKLIKLAKDSISSFFEDKDVEVSDALKKEFKTDTAVFVSLYIKDELIGCIGFSDPMMPLWDAVVKAARGAAFEDPRFPPLQEEQMKDLRIELSVLTDPKEIEVTKPSEYLEKVEIGKDGLVIRDAFGVGLLLPQVAVEWGWDSKKFLDETCRKAGLSPDCWNNMKQNVYKFQAQVFTEEKGKIVEKKLQK
jgi:uncharacterized protein (TIGR00296 family)